MTGINAVIFDLDGVLVDSHEVMGKAFAVAYAEVVGQGPAPFEEYQRYQGLYFPEIMRRMGLPLEMEEPFVRESSRLAEQIPVIDGVPDLLAALCDNGLRLAVATGKAGWRARSLLTTLKLSDFFTAIVGSDEIANPKPAPDIALHALALLRIEPAAAVMVGDAPADIRCARGAGVTAIAATWATVDEDDLLDSDPHVVLHKPGMLLEWLSAQAVSP
ncbi:HAD-IA family hydrolase [Actinacidiphila oryziradicis]|uniref:HAD family hydrolase n=1 Tax=Actinacidiphila oryziradicis TaxID=2571141 RepID=A0A4U0SRC5_9ACTN|nr:HAD-IA family hydrolase [Actinacidiphila oryziradicis]TKA02935.1 HAD family hydrolase [Actinacidiphila oryziradicis]